jgi:hypothetical protein
MVLIGEPNLALIRAHEILTNSLPVATLETRGSGI